MSNGSFTLGDFALFVQQDRLGVAVLVGLDASERGVDVLAARLDGRGRGVDAARPGDGRLGEVTARSALIRRTARPACDARND